MHAARIPVLLLLAFAACQSTAPQPASEPAREPATPQLTGHVRDASGKPLAGVVVSAYAGFATRWTTAECFTDADGGSSVDAASCGSMVREKSHDVWDFQVGLALSGTTYASVDGESWWDVRVSGVPGVVLVHDFTLVPGGAVEGKLVDARTSQALRADLRIYTGESGAMHFFRYVSTDQNGWFRTEGLPAGEYTADVNDPKLDYPVVGRFTIAAGGTARVELALAK